MTSLRVNTSRDLLKKLGPATCPLVCVDPLPVPDDLKYSNHITAGAERPREGNKGPSVGGREGELKPERLKEGDE